MKMIAEYGEKTLTAEDYINGKHFDDSVCYAFYLIDLHIMNGIKQKFFEDNKIGAIVPKRDFTNKY